MAPQSLVLAGFGVAVGTGVGIFPQCGVISDQWKGICYLLLATCCLLLAAACFLLPATCYFLAAT